MITSCDNKDKVKITLFGNNAANIYQQKNHALIGVSPFNSYFTEKKLIELLRWGLVTFNQVSIFLPDEISFFTLIALGYSHKKAIYKTQRQDRYLKNKVFRAFRELGFSTAEAERALITSSKLSENSAYCALYQACLQRFENEIEFKNGCLSTSFWMLTKHLKLSTTLIEEELKLAVQYFLKEIPLFLDTPSILGVQSSLFAYHVIPEYLIKIYQDNQLVSPKQSYIKIQFMEEHINI